MVTRRHHPLQGQRFEILSGGKSTLVILHKDGANVKIPRQWTDVDGVESNQAKGEDSYFTVEGLRELLQLVTALCNR